MPSLLALWEGKGPDPVADLVTTSEDKAQVYAM
jgi:hypothetical protein